MFRQLAPNEAPPILRGVTVNPTTETIVLTEKGEICKIAETLASKLQQRAPKFIATNQQLSAAPTLIIGLQSEIDALLAIVSAKDAASFEALIRPLPHYGRQSYIAVDGREAIEKGIWPMQVQQMMVE